MDLLQGKFMNNISSRERMDEKGLFLKRIGTLLEEGYSLKDALLFLGKIGKGLTIEWIISIQEGLGKGQNFHEELKKIGFSDKICSQIYLASKYGDYGKTITRCGEQLLDEIERKKKMQSLLRYPFLLICFLIGMLLLMRYLILPHMESIFVTSNAEVNIYSNWLVTVIYYSPQIIISFILITILIYIVGKNKLEKMSIIKRFEYFMRFPFLSNYLKDYWSHFFFFEWGNLFKNGCSYQEIIMIMKGEDASKLLQETGEILSQEMQTGKAINESLQVLPFFHKEGILVVTHGENLGKLSIEMLIYASHCQNEFELRVERLMNKIQPVIFCFIALMIVGIYASLMLPIFSLMEGF